MLLKPSEAFNRSHSVPLCYAWAVLLSLILKVAAVDLLFSELILTLIMLPFTYSVPGKKSGCVSVCGRVCAWMLWQSSYAFLCTYSRALSHFLTLQFLPLVKFWYKIPISPTRHVSLYIFLSEECMYSITPLHWEKKKSKTPNKSQFSERCVGDHQPLCVHTFVHLPLHQGK